MKRCLILQGGGLRAAFVAGACFALADLGISQFELALAVSASVPTLTYFLSGQCKEGREVWENYVCTKRLIRYSNLLWCWSEGYRHRPLIDLHYLVYQVIRDRFPLRIDRLLSSKTEAYFVATDTKTYHPHYFRPDEHNIYQVMCACMALPGAVAEKPLIHGRGFIDGGVVDPLPIRKALELGGDRFLVILTVPPGTVHKKLSFVERMAARRYFADNPGLSDACYVGEDSLEACFTQLEKIRTEGPGAVLVIRPEKPLPARRVTRDRRKIVDTLQIGYDQVMRNEKEIKTFLR